MTMDLKEKHKLQEIELLERKWELVYDPTPMPLNKLGRLKFLYLDKAGITNMTGIELGLVLHAKHFIKIVKYIAKDKTGKYLPPEMRWYHLNIPKVSDIPRIIEERK